MRKGRQDLLKGLAPADGARWLGDGGPDPNHIEPMGETMDFAPQNLWLHAAA
ncbi:hypothetical protein [Phenylobacterium sp.]|uniref:hypothetical protein n=1 Tax=Phenylobacterium sp. TaxID=1871053 RepID=UPI002F4050A0